MATISITFANELNTSLQVGDIAYSNTQLTIQSPTGGGMPGPMINAMLLGPVVGISDLTVEIHISSNGNVAPNVGEFIFFSKNKNINTSSLLGYYADVKFENNSTNKIELFSIGSEVSESSK